MKLTIDGKINPYYVQTLCMIFFPGEKFGAQAMEEPDSPELTLTFKKKKEGVEAFVTVAYAGKTAEAVRFAEYNATRDPDKAVKMASGAAVIAACGELLGYRPSWGMLTGVRPSKVATELLQSGLGKTKTKKALSADYLVIPKKAALATDVALNEQKIIGQVDPRDCSVYISIPFCPTRCAYCSFVSYTSSKLLSLIPEYLTHLLLDLQKTFATIKRLGLKVKTVYIGGGTPTILTAEQLRLLLSEISRQIDVSALEEFTLESGRPDTITAEKFAVAKEYGVTRVCVNPQSLCEEVLSRIGRCHSVEEFFRAFEVARESGIPNINTDLIVGLPGDTFKTFSATFDKILSLSPENITVHTFCIKKAAEIVKTGNSIYSFRGGDAGKCVDYSQLKAQQEGYLPYDMYRQKNTVGNLENVGFAKEGTEGRYNVYMMEEVHSIFACGAGAVAKLVDYNPLIGGKPIIERLFYPKYPYEYLKDDSTDEKNAAIERFYTEHGLI